MRKGIRRLLWLGPIVALSAAFMVLGQQTPGDKPSDPGGVIAVMLSVPKARCKADEGFPIIVAFANLGPDVAYIQKIDRPFLRLYDAGGLRLMGDPIPEPGPPPADWYIRMKGKKVLVSPVWRLESLGGVVRVVPNALARYLKEVTKGAYHVRMPIRSLKTYDKSAVIRRTDVKHALWVRADAVGKRVGVRTNSVEIHIAEE